MDIFNIYSVKDEMTQKFMQPIFMENDDLAKRIFKTQINTIEIWKNNSEDFSLYKIGTFDQASGTTTSNIEKIVGGRSVLNA